jgi:tetratricopeptide (TPR) repeat protein
LAIAREIGLALSPQEQTLLSTAPKVNPAAFDDYIRGRQQLELWTREGTVSAITLLKRATTNDPNLAVAYAAIVEALTFGDSDLPSLKRNAEAREAADRAIQVAGDTSGEALVALGLVKYVIDLDWNQAERAFTRGLDLNPHFGAGHHMYAHLLLTIGRTNKARFHSQRFLELDPYSPAAHHHLGYHYFFTRQYDLAIQSELDAVRIKPNYADSYRMLADAYVAQGKNEEAETNAFRAINLSPKTDFYRADLARVLVQVGKREAGQSLLDDLRSQTSPDNLPAFSMGCFYVALGDRAEAFRWLRRAVQERWWAITELPYHPALDPIRQDPQFVELLAEMKLPGR